MRLSLIGLLVPLVAASEPRKPPCDGAPKPALGKPAAERTNAGPASIAHTSDGELVFAFVGYGMFPRTQASVTWLFRLAGDKVETIGEVARAAAKLARGTGTPVIHAGIDASVCGARGKVELPVPPETQTVAAAVEGATLAMARAE